MILNRGQTMVDKEKVRVTMEEMKVKGNQLVDKVKELIEEGNARSLQIRKDDRTLMEIPLSIGVGGATAAIFIMPTLAAVGALAALVSDVDIVIEREHPDVTDVEVEEVETEAK
jgi:hypothetical protein